VPVWNIGRHCWRRSNGAPLRMWITASKYDDLATYSVQVKRHHHFASAAPLEGINGSRQNEPATTIISTNLILRLRLGADFTTAALRFALMLACKRRLGRLKRRGRRYLHTHEYWGGPGFA
jgi:type I restriction enzyme S subunit